MKKLTGFFFLFILIFAGCVELATDTALIEEQIDAEGVVVGEAPILLETANTTYDAGVLAFDHPDSWTVQMDGEGALYDDEGNLKMKIALAGEIESSCFIELQAISYLDMNGRDWDYSLTMLSMPGEMEGLEGLDLSGLCGDTSGISPDDRVAELNLKGDDDVTIAILSYYYVEGNEVLAQVEFEAILDSLVLK